MASSQRALASLLLLAQSHGLERLKFVTNVRSPTAKQVGCPYAQRVWMALELAEVDYERVEIDLRAKPDWFLEASPLGNAPQAQVPAQTQSIRWNFSAQMMVYTSLWKLSIQMMKKSHRCAWYATPS